LKTIQIDYNEELLLVVRHFEESASGLKHNYTNQVFLLHVPVKETEKKADLVEVSLPWTRPEN
jgi:hypothetical protein